MTIKMFDIAVLESEKSIQHISEKNLEIRRNLVKKFEEMPSEFFTQIRHLQPQVGCLNRCSFCSQSAGLSIWYLNKEGLSNLFSALKTVAIKVACEHLNDEGLNYISETKVLTKEGVFSSEFQMPSTGLLGYGRKNHRPGVLFCYLDNDISSYPYLDDYLKYAYEDLGVKIRISTVGYSRLNTHLSSMHERINTNHLDALAGVRLSITPYTYGWTMQGEKSGMTSRKEFTKDISNFLHTYRPAIEYLGTGQRTGCVEFRFKPLLETRLDFEELYFNGYHAFRIGPYALVSTELNVQLNTASVNVSSEKVLQIEGEAKQYLMMQSDQIRNFSNKDFHRIIMEAANGVQDRESFKYSYVSLYRLANEDGHYYAVEPFMREDGVYTKQFYPASNKRKFSGYIDSERYFLNSLLEHKRESGVLTRRGKFEHSDWNDVQAVLTKIQTIATGLDNIDLKCSNYIKEEIIPIISSYIDALQGAGYSPSYFFDSTFTIDTGSICNLGQAFHEFKDIASRPHLPLTPQHERSYGLNSSLSIEGKVWRLSVMPIVKDSHDVRAKLTGKRNVATEQPTLLIEEQDLEQQSLSTPEGPIIRRKTIPFNGVEKTGFKEGTDQYTMIGQVKKNSNHNNAAS